MKKELPVVFFLILFGTITLDFGDDIQTLDGKTYKNAKVVGKSATTISIIDDDGGAQIEVINLPPEIQTKYGFDPAESKQNAADEAAQRNTEAIKAREAAALERSSLTVKGRIIQALPDGIIAELETVAYKEIDVPHQSISSLVPAGLGHAPTYTVQTWTESEIVNQGHSLGTVFVQCDSSGLADDSAWSGKIWKIGTYSYNSVGAGYKTLPKFTDQPDVYQDAQKNIETVRTSPITTPSGDAKASGTGFFITSSGYMLTANHVVKSASTVKVRNKDGGLMPAKIVRSDPVNDIAILKVEGTFDSLPLSNISNVKLGETVFTIGFPNTLIQGVKPKMTKGEISSLDGMQDDPRMFQISVPVQPGNSGGCLVDEGGNVVGIVTSKLDAVNVASATGDIPQNVNYALKISYAQLLLNSLGEEQKKLVPMSVAPVAFTDAVAKADRATAQILAY